MAQSTATSYPTSHRSNHPQADQGPVPSKLEENHRHYQYNHYRQSSASLFVWCQPVSICAQ
eukprot:2083512-Ditylum_brightwellii.AAC.1